MNDSTILEAQGLTKQFGAGETAVTAVQDVSLQIEKGELVLIMGPSGSGKTTLLSMLGGLLRPTSGSILIGGVDITRMSEHQLPRIRAQQIGFIFQAFNLLEALTVEENVLLPSELAPGGTRAARKRAADLLEALDLGARRRAYPATLSGGEKQRVAIARALINRAPLVLADEPNLQHLRQRRFRRLAPFAERRGRQRALAGRAHRSRERRDDRIARSQSALRPALEARGAGSHFFRGGRGGPTLLVSAGPLRPSDDRVSLLNHASESLTLRL